MGSISLVSKINGINKDGLQYFEKDSLCAAFYRWSLELTAAGDSVTAAVYKNIGDMISHSWSDPPL